jgi:peroxiredoxin Q/BCP
MVSIGSPAPLFNTTNQDGNAVSLANFKGQKVVLYFYPKDNTPTCTTQACNLRDNYPAFLAKGYVVLGISPDSEKSHGKFIAKHQLPFTLLVDTDAQIAQQYGVWQLKKMMGKEYMGIVRTTFVIDEAGNIAQIISQVKSSDHATQILG